MTTLASCARSLPFGRLSEGIALALLLLFPGAAEGQIGADLQSLPLFLGGGFVTIGNLDGLGPDEIVVGQGQGGGPLVRTFRADNSDFGLSFLAYHPLFTGGVRVAACDVNGDGISEIVTAPGPGGGPHVRVWKITGATVTELFGFFAYDPLFTGGVWVACAASTGGGARLLTGPDAGGGPHVRVWEIGQGPPVEVAGFMAYDPLFTGGVRVATCDVTGDGVPDILTGAGPGGGPHVQLRDGADSSQHLASFFAYTPAFTAGVFVACAGDGGLGAPRIVTSPDAGGGPHVRGFRSDGVPIGLEFFAYPAGFTGGVRIAAGQTIAGGPSEIATLAGPSGGPHLATFTDQATSAGTNLMALEDARTVLKLLNQVAFGAITRWVKSPILVWFGPGFSQADGSAAVAFWSDVLKPAGTLLQETSVEAAADVVFRIDPLFPPGPICGGEGPSLIVDHVILAGNGTYSPAPQCTFTGTTAQTALIHGLGHVLGLVGHTPSNTDVMSTPQSTLRLSPVLREVAVTLYSLAPGTILP
jgi:hypothetical protein